MKPNSVWSVGQDLTSFDCGFFSGYVVSELGRIGSLNFELTRELVYRRRNAYRHGGGNLGLNPDTLTGGLNDPKAMLNYLDFLGCHNYRLAGANPKHSLGSTQDENLIRSVLHRCLPKKPGRDALLLSVYAPAKAHWIAILARDAGSGQYAIYDPGKTAPPYCYSAHEDKLVPALSDAMVHFTVWRHKELQTSRKSHRVQAGESLSAIAGQYWGDVMLFPLLFDANTDAIGSDWNRLQVGTLLTVPDGTTFDQTDRDLAHRRARNWA